MSKTRKSPNIAKIMVCRYFFKQKLLFFVNDVCQSITQGATQDNLHSEIIKPLWVYNTSLGSDEHS